MIKKLNHWKANTRRFVTVGLTTILFAFGPMLGAVSIGEAKPPDHAPAWGYRRKHDDNNWSRRRKRSSKRRYRSNKRYNRRYRSNYRYNKRRSYTTRDLGNKNHIRKRKAKSQKKSWKKSQKKRERRRN